MDESLLTFTGALASSAPTPGGGGAAALMGSLAASLGAMAARLSAGKKACAENAAALEAIVSDCEALRLDFLGQIEADAAAFLPLAAAYRIPREEPGRAEKLRRASLEACAAAEEMLRLSLRTAELLTRLKAMASRLLLSDVGCAAAACRAALLCAAYNVFVNTRAWPGDPEAQKRNALAETALEQGLALLEEIEVGVLLELRNEET